MSEILDVKELKKTIQKFANERDWEQFHNPKNLAMALSVESSELLEIFQWLTLEQSERVAELDGKYDKVRDEIADIIVYAVRICDILDIDISKTIEEKMKKNGEKYPIEKAKGNAKKYNEY